MAVQVEAHARELAAQVDGLQQQIATQEAEAADVRLKLTALESQVAHQQAQPASRVKTDADQIRAATRKVLLAQVRILPGFP